MMFSSILPLLFITIPSYPIVSDSTLTEDEYCDRYLLIYLRSWVTVTGTQQIILDMCVISKLSGIPEPNIMMRYL
jgi:hypothetical protein